MIPVGVVAFGKNQCFPPHHMRDSAFPGEESFRAGIELTNITDVYFVNSKNEIVKSIFIYRVGRTPEVGQIGSMLRSRVSRDMKGRVRWFQHTTVHPELVEGSKGKRGTGQQAVLWRPVLDFLANLISWFVRGSLGSV